MVLVALARPEDAVKFLEEMECSLTMVCDPQAELYERLGFASASLGQLLNFNVLKNSMKAFSEGARPGAPQANPKQLGGTVILGANGEVLWRHADRDASDHADADEIASKLDALREAP